MSNTLTALEPTLFSAARDVASDPMAAIAAINSNFDDKGVAIGDKVTVPVAPTRSPSTYTPANVPASGTSATATSIDVEITDNRYVDWVLSGEEMRSLENGTINQDWMRQLVAQGMRSLRNEAEADCCAAIKAGASFAVGAAGTTPFGSNLDVLAEARKGLQDRGAPLADMSCVMNTSAGLNLRKLNIFQQADQAGSDGERRTGRFLPQFGFNLNETAGISAHTAGAGASASLSPTYLVDYGSGYAAGTTDVNIDTGTGAFVAQDIVQFASDGNNYVITEAETGGNDTVLNLSEPGLMAAISDGDAVVGVGNYTPNLVFERSAVVGIMRPPLIPQNPVIQTRLVSDQLGLTYLFAQIAQDGQITWRLHLAWGFKAIMPSYIGILMG